jgi:hypothetical protein
MVSASHMQLEASPRHKPLIIYTLGTRHMSALTVCLLERRKKQSTEALEVHFLTIRFFCSLSGAVLIAMKPLAWYSHCVGLTMWD